MLLEVALPLSLAFIMFSLGFGLTFADFGRVLTMPRAVFAGIMAQVILLPVIAWLILVPFNLPPALAFGVLLLSFCPGGVTSNILAKIGGGNVALSITLTAVVSLMSVVTVPLFVSWGAATTLGEAAPEIDVTSIAIAMFAITALPVLIGLTIRHFAPAFAKAADRIISGLATLLFVVIVVAALATNWQIFIENAAQLAPVLVLLNLVLLVLGVAVARGLGLAGPDGLAISIELGVQNATLGITVAGLIAVTGGISEYALPSAIYGITMYVVTIPSILIFKRLYR